jgi:hypothetical protein
LRISMFWKLGPMSSALTTTLSCSQSKVEGKWMDGCCVQGRTRAARPGYTRTSIWERLGMWRL